MVKLPRRGAAQPTTKSTSTKQPDARQAAGADGVPTSRLKQIGMVAGLIRKSDPKALPVIIGSGVGVIVVFVVVGLLIGLQGLLIPLGVLLGVLTTMILFGRYAQSAQYAAIDGQPGAAAAVIQSMRGNWSITPAIAGNRNMDIVHRVVGPAGVVLIGEGSPNGLNSLISAEKKKISRVAYGIPITDLQVGNDEGQVSIKQLQRKLRMLPRELKPSAISDLNTRLKTLRPSLQPPKGPMPRQGRMPKAPRPKVR